MATSEAPRSPSYSLRKRLLWLLLVAVALTALVQGSVAYYTAEYEADEIFDYQMQQMVRALHGRVPSVSSQSLRDEADFDFVIQIWALDGTPIFAPEQREALPRQPGLGFSEFTTHGKRYRIFSMRTETQVVQIAQDVAARHELAGSLALGMVGPIIVLAPLLMIAVWWVVTKSTQPLARAREQIANRTADDLSPLRVPGLPDEVRPLVDAVNLMFARVAEAFEAQRNFVADAAHELRSPLAALRLQIQAIQRAHGAESNDIARRRLLAGIDRLARLVDQMLVLARQDAAADVTVGARIDLRAIVTLAIGDAISAAQERHIDLGIVEAESITIIGDAEALSILLRNLLDNAIKFAPEGGTVDVAIRRQDGQAVLEIADSGPGIALEERNRVFDRFYRVVGGSAVGSGLGLAIAQGIARWHHATITLGTSARLGGLLVTVHFAEAQP